MDNKELQQETLQDETTDFDPAAGMGDITPEVRAEIMKQRDEVEAYG